MRRWLAIGVFAAVVANAQEGFPLDGTWRGAREATGVAPVTVVMVMQWDGQKITGVINPGPEAIPISDARLIPEGWRVTIAARTRKGEPISFDGVVSELGKYDRSITGTWKEGAHSYHIRMVRE